MIVKANGRNLEFRWLHTAFAVLPLLPKTNNKILEWPPAAKIIDPSMNLLQLGWIAISRRKVRRGKKKDILLFGKD